MRAKDEQKNTLGIPDVQTLRATEVNMEPLLQDDVLNLVRCQPR
jgi:hypothetical protein